MYVCVLILFNIRAIYWVPEAADGPELQWLRHWLGERTVTVTRPWGVFVLDSDNTAGQEYKDKQGSVNTIQYSPIKKVWVWV